jgi:hypothetical protein
MPREGTERLPPEYCGRDPFSTFGEDKPMIDQTDNVFDLNAVLHPGTVFDHPRDVVADTTLSLAEKRAILASWASDAAAVTSNPALRELAGTRRIVTIDEVLEALSMLDDKPSGPPGGKPMRQKSASRVALAA